MTFLKSLRESPSVEVSVLVHSVGRDVQTTTGSNLQYIKEMTSLDPWRSISRQVKKVLMNRLTDMPDSDIWRLPYLARLLEQRGELHHKMVDTSELTELVDSLCVN